MVKTIGIHNIEEESSTPLGFFDTATSFIKSHTDAEVNFGSARATLPQQVMSHTGFVHVRNRKVGNFYAVSEEALTALINEAINKPIESFSFFDGMEDFKADREIGLSTLDNIEQRPAEYSDQELNKLKQLRNTLNNSVHLEK